MEIAVSSAGGGGGGWYMDSEATTKIQWSAGLQALRLFTFPRKLTLVIL